MLRYEPSGGFDRNWQGPPELKPRVYRSQSEKDTWFAIGVENEYRLPDLTPDDVIIDIGANIGAFSHLAYRKGSRSIYAFELEEHNMKAAVPNIEGMEDGIALYHCAVVRGDDHRSAQYVYNGSWNSFGVVGTPVASRSLDEILDPHDSVRFLKIDVEGCEWPILYTCSQLGKVQDIAGEYHIIPQYAAEVQNLPHAVSIEALEQFLTEQGFNTIFKQNGPTIGNFWAWRVTQGHTPPPTLRDRLREIAGELRSIADAL